MDLTFDKTALAGHTVLLTGAGGGIGRETALAFAALGAFVLLPDIDRARGEQATAAVNLRFPQAAHFLHGNGYYRLIDRQIKMGEASGADILHRNSFNFDLGLYDADTNTLYFCRMDT